MSDLQTLFSTDPLKLTAADFIAEYEAKHGRRPLDDIIAHYREARAKFELGDKTAGNKKKLAGESSGVKIDAKDLDDILKGL